MKVETLSQIDWEKTASLIEQSMNINGESFYDVSKSTGIPEALLETFVAGKRRPNISKMVKILNQFDLNENNTPLLKDRNIAAKIGNKVFISYSHFDSDYMDRLMVHLKPLQKKGLIDPWVDTRIKPGDKWKKEIEEALNQAKAAVLLISANFLASDFIVDNELPPLLRSASDKGTLIIPVILKPCRFARDTTLNEFQAVNSPDSPICSLSEYNQELIYDTISQRVEEWAPEPA